MNDVLEQVETLTREALPELVALRHDLHAHPQLGYEETYASALVQRELKAMGVAFESGLAETGVVGWITPDGEAGRRDAIGLRADMDALPIEEQTGLPYASQHPGRMHACGHDGHTTVLLGAARVLQQVRRALPRPVKLVFQPAEEGGGGADRLVKAGVLTDKVGRHHVACMFGLHGWPRLPLGQVATRVGPLLAATDNVFITLSGPGGHAAFPHVTADPVVCAAQLVTALQAVVSRMVSPTRPAVLSITTVHGGDAENVIPDRVALSGTVRTTDGDTRRTVIERADHTAKQVAAAHGCGVEFRLEMGYPVTQNDAAYTRRVMRMAEGLLGEGRAVELPEPVMGGEDFSYYGRHVPACFVFLGMRPAGKGTAADLHTPAFDFNDDAIGAGVELMCRAALDGDAHG